MCKAALVLLSLASSDKVMCFKFYRISFPVKLHPTTFLLEGKDCKALPKGLAVQTGHTPNKQGRDSVYWGSIWPRTFLTWSLLIILWASCSLLSSHAPSFPPYCDVPPPGALPHTFLQAPHLSPHLLSPVRGLHEGHAHPTVLLGADAVAEVSEPLFFGTRLPRCFPTSIPPEKHPQAVRCVIYSPLLGEGLRLSVHLCLCSWKSQKTHSGVSLITEQAGAWQTGERMPETGVSFSAQKIKLQT